MVVCPSSPVRALRESGRRRSPVDLLGTLGGAQLGAQVGNSVYDWWKGMSKPPQAAIDPYDSYNDWQG